MQQSCDDLVQVAPEVLKYIVKPKEIYSDPRFTN